MARVLNLSFELNSVTTNVEVTVVSGAVTVTSSSPISGSYSGRVSGLVSATPARFTLRPSSSQNNFYVRVNTKFTTFPLLEDRIFEWSNSSTLGTNVIAYVTVDGSGLLRLYDEDGQIGSASSALSTGTVYRLEFHIDVSVGAGSQTVEGKIDGTNFATASNRSISVTTMSRFHAGGNLASEVNVTGDWMFDDIAVNNTSLGSQTGYPGQGYMIVMRPNAAGDNTGWTPLSGNNFENVDEVTPDGTTTYNSSNTLDQIDDYDLEAAPAAIGASDTINVVAVGIRYLGAAASANASSVLRIKASSGGTVEESTAFTTSSTSGVTNNSSTAAEEYIFTLYDLPGASSTAWTKSDLGTTQIGVRLSATNTNAFRNTTQWLLVDYTPAAPGGGGNDWPILSQNKFWGWRNTS